jgi:UDP-N-acetyl-D-glucosamine dehydrogenase
MRKYDFKMKSVPLVEKTLKSYDCVVIATDHSIYDYEFILKHSSLVVDTRNAANGLEKKGNLVKA